MCVCERERDWGGRETEKREGERERESLCAQPSVFMSLLINAGSFPSFPPFILAVSDPRSHYQINTLKSGFLKRSEEDMTVKGGGQEGGERGGGEEGGGCSPDTLSGERRQHEKPTILLLSLLNWRAAHLHAAWPGIIDTSQKCCRMERKQWYSRAVREYSGSLTGKHVNASS